jgi:cadmium resistance protein CadD (predicted permease)
MIADQRPGKNSGPALANYRNEASIFRCSAFFGLFLKMFQREEIIKLWGLIPILILIHAVDYSEIAGRIAD